MYITFLIGNGFDINIGLNTRYSDFYKFFLENANQSNMIQNWIKEERYLWSDLELCLGQKINTINEKTLNQFYEDKLELDQLLVEYLEAEQNRFEISEDNKSVVENELARSIKELTKGFSVVDKDLIEEVKKVCRNEVYEYQFITFNYTDILTRIVNKCKKDNVDIGTHINALGNQVVDKLGSVLHVHGTVKSEAILGVNDASQINNDFLRSESIFLDTFIKRQINDSLGQRRTERAQNIISKSQIICIFGMSIGATDKMWWQELVNWLLENHIRKLVIFWKDDDPKLYRRIPLQIIRLKDKIRKMFLEEGSGKHSEEEINKIREQIIIIINSPIFSFPKVCDGFFSFDYSNNNGVYVIGNEEEKFSTQWSKGSDTIIHAYSDADDIEHIARISNVENIFSVSKEELFKLDYSSRCRDIRIGDIVVWKNIYGHYLLTCVKEIHDDTRGADKDFLECEYRIIL